jgi:hypothetical protein
MASRLLRAKIYWASLFGWVVTFGALFWRYQPLNGDVAWYLYASGRLLKGATLYRDLNDANLPVVFWFHVPFAFLSELFRVPPAAVLFAGVTLLLGFSLRRLHDVLRPLLPPAAVLVLLFWIAFYLIGWNPLQFGQRDVIAGFLFVIVVAGIAGWLDQPGPRSKRSLLLLFVAAIALSFKPYLLIPWTLVIGYALRRRGLAALRIPEFVLVFATGAASACAGVLTDYPRVARLAVKYYDAYNQPAVVVLVGVWPALLVGAVALLLPAVSRLKHILTLCALASLGFAAECLLQRKGWEYHTLPCRLWAGITFFLFVADRLLSRVWTARAAYRGGFALSLVPCILAASLALALPAVVRRSADAPREYLLRAGAGRTVLPLSTDLWTSYPLILEAGARNVYAGPSLWVLPGIARTWRSGSPYRDIGSMGADERQLVTTVADCIASHPDYILLDPRRRKQGLGPEGFDFIEYFSADPRFREEIRNYDPGPRSDRCLLLRRTREACR